MMLLIIEDFFTGYKLRIAISKKICYNAFERMYMQKRNCGF